MTALPTLKSSNAQVWLMNNRFAVNGGILLFHLILLGLFLLFPPVSKQQQQPPIPLPMVVVELTPPVPLTAGGQTNVQSTQPVTATNPVATLSTPQIEGATAAPSHAPAKPLAHTNMAPTPTKTSSPTTAVNNVALSTESTTSSESAISSRSAASSGASSGNDTTSKATHATASAAPTASASDNNFSAPQFGAGYLSNPAPEYPTTARRLGEQGKVLLHVLVTPAGLAKKVKLHHSSGSDSLDGAALKAVQKWRFVSAKLGEQSVEAWVYVPIVFKLD